MKITGFRPFCQKLAVPLAFLLACALIAGCSAPPGQTSPPDESTASADPTASPAPAKPTAPADPSALVPPSDSDKPASPSAVPSGTEDITLFEFSPDTAAASSALLAAYQDAEFKKKFASTVDLAYNGDEMIMLWVTQPVTDFVIEHVNGNAMEATANETLTIYELAELDGTQLITLGTTVPEGTPPIMRVKYKLADGTAQAFAIGWSGKTGNGILFEVK